MQRVLLAALSAIMVAACATPDRERVQREEATLTPRTTSPSGSAAADDPDAASGWGPTLAELATARQLVARMSTEQQASQVMMPAFWGYRADRVTAAEGRRNRVSHGHDTASGAVAAHRYGGVFIRPEAISDARQVHRLVTRLHEKGDVPDGLPLLVSVDQEGGSVQRIQRGVTRWPSARSIGRTGDVRLARTIAMHNGRELRAMGFTMALAPVADVDTAGNVVVGSRSFSADHAKAARFVSASIEGFLKAGVIPVVKHFPGHGSVHGDSHHDLPVQGKSLAQLLRSDLVPFSAAVEGGAPAIMTAHISVPQVDDDGVPASLSRDVVTGLLRDELGFRGLIVTDSQGMGPVYGPYGSAESAVRSLIAGNDLILNSPHATSTQLGIVGAVRSGRLPAARLADAATRVVAARLYQQRIGAQRPPMSILRSAPHLAAAARAARGP